MRRLTEGVERIRLATVYVGGDFRRHPNKEVLDAESTVDNQLWPPFYHAGLPEVWALDRERLDTGMASPVTYARLVHTPLTISGEQVAESYAKLDLLPGHYELYIFGQQVRTVDVDEGDEMFLGTWRWTG